MAADAPAPAVPASPAAEQLRIASYNILTGRRWRLESALRAMDQMGVDFGFFLEAKLTEGIHTRYSSEYHVLATSAPSPHQGGIAMFYKDSPRWHVESVRYHGPNVMSCMLVTASRRFGVVGAYLPPADTDTLDYLTAALDCFPRDCIPVVLGDLNVDLDDLRTARDHAIATELMAHSLLNLLHHYRQRRRYRHCHTWSQLRQGERVSSRCDYILSTSTHWFRNVALRTPSLFGSDHLLILADLHLSPLLEHWSYTKGRARLPLKLPKYGPLTRAELSNLTPRPRPSARERRPWVSTGTWKLVDERAAFMRSVHYNQTYARQLSRRIHQLFKTDRKHRVEAAGANIEAALIVHDVQRAWDHAKAWYRQAEGRPPKPSREDLNIITRERVDLYRQRNSPGDPIPVIIDPFVIPDEPPSEVELAETVKRFKRGKPQVPPVSGRITSKIG